MDTRRVEHKHRQGPPEPFPAWRPAGEIPAGDLRTTAWDIDSNIHHPTSAARLMLSAA
jgi:hypothetical protein